MGDGKRGKMGKERERRGREHNLVDKPKIPSYATGSRSLTTDTFETGNTLMFVIKIQ